MKYCSKCGNELMEEAVVCLKCGCAIEGSKMTETAQGVSANSGLKTAAKILMILGTIVTSLAGFLIPLAWCLPMTISYFNKTKRGETVSTGFKVCSLLFVSLLGGVLMLCDKD